MGEYKLQSWKKGVIKRRKNFILGSPYKVYNGDYCMFHASLFGRSILNTEFCPIILMNIF